MDGGDAASSVYTNSDPPRKHRAIYFPFLTSLPKSFERWFLLYDGNQMCSRRLLTELQERRRRGKLSTDLSGTNQNIVVFQRSTSCYLDQLPEENPGLLRGDVRVLNRQKTTRTAKYESGLPALREDMRTLQRCCIVVCVYWSTAPGSCWRNKQLM